MPRIAKRSKIKKIIRNVLFVFVLFISALLLFTLSEVLFFKYVNPPLTFGMIRGWVHQKTGIRYYRCPAYEWRDLDDISPYLRQAVLAGEDQRFLHHHGFDFIEFKEAIKGVFQTGRIRGASTISMQAARSLFLWTDRTLLRKIIEAYYTILMELLWNKERILEVYLNTADWGGGVIGAEAASCKYFGTRANLLKSDEAASLAAMAGGVERMGLIHYSPRYIERDLKQLLKEAREIFPDTFLTRDGQVIPIPNKE